MKVIIDENTGYKLHKKADTVVQALGEIIEHLDSRGRALLSITVDGDPVSPDDLRAALGPRKIDATDTLEIRSEQIDVLVRQSLDEMAGVLPELAVACHTMAEVIGSAPLEETCAAFNELTVIWRAIKTRQRQIADGMKLDIDAMSIDDQSLAEWERGLLSTFDAGRKAFEKADAAALSELISYELAPRAEIEEKINDLLLASIPKNQEATAQSS